MNSNATEAYAGDINFKAIADLSGYHFEVKDYQRGYKWSPRQVADLLEDVDEFKQPAPSFYCLQPVVVKCLNDNPNQWELIDGQQRLTTIYIVLQALQPEENCYQIQYDTRTGSRTFLEEISTLSDFTEGADLPFSSQDLDPLQEKIKVLWNEYIEGHPSDDNIDNYHFFSAWCTIKAWANVKAAETLLSFIPKLKKQVKVIWYQPLSALSTEDVFMNLNSGKIPLTSAELIKALFLLNLHDNTQPEVSKLRQNQLALEWDTIEKNLQQDEFWYFIHKANLATRIDLLFHLSTGHNMADKSSDKVYRHYAERLKHLPSEKATIQILDFWKKVKDHYELLHEWYHDREIYHWAGFLVSEQLTTISDLVSENKGKTKSGFKAWLRDQIGNEMAHDRYNFDKIGYGQNAHLVKRLLRYFNIVTYHHSDPAFRFPFYRLHEAGTTWSLEHIFPQNAREFTDKKDVMSWIINLQSILKKPENNEVEKETQTKENENMKELNRLSAILSSMKETKGETVKQEWKDVLREIESTLESRLDLHHINNLALLDSRTNTALGNGSFYEKRMKVIELDQSARAKDQAFIPIATKNVFLKYYSQPGNEADHITNFWGFNDRENYQQALEQAKDLFKKTS